MASRSVYFEQRYTNSRYGHREFRPPYSKRYLDIELSRRGRHCDVYLPQDIAFLVVANRVRKIDCGGVTRWFHLVHPGSVYFLPFKIFFRKVLPLQKSEIGVKVKCFGQR